MKHETETSNLVLTHFPFWGPRDGKGFVATLISPSFGHPETEGVKQPFLFFRDSRGPLPASRHWMLGHLQVAGPEKIPRPPVLVIDSWLVVTCGPTAPPPPLWACNLLAWSLFPLTKTPRPEQRPYVGAWKVLVTLLGVVARKGKGSLDFSVHIVDKASGWTQATTVGGGTWTEIPMHCTVGVMHQHSQMAPGSNMVQHECSTLRDLPLGRVQVAMLCR